MRLALLAGAIVLSLAVTAPSFPNGWYLDDLHLIRSYSSAELASVWHGTVDTDNLETPGYRPLENAYYELTYLAFGESQASYRVLAAIEMGIGVWLFALLLAELGLPLWAAAGAGATALTAKTIVYSTGWISINYQALQLATFSAAVLLTALAARRGPGRSNLLFAGSLVTWVVTLLIKDQALVLVPVMIIVPLVAVADLDEAAAATGVRVVIRRALGAVAAGARRRDIAPFLVAVVASVLADLALRKAFVPDAPFKVAPESVLTLTFQIGHAVALDDGDHGPGALAFYALVAVVAGAGLFIGGLRALAKDPSGRPAVLRMLLLGASLALFVITSSGFGIIRHRPDLALIPGVCYAGLLWTAVALVARAGVRRRMLAAVVLSTAAVSAALSLSAGFAFHQLLGPRTAVTYAGAYEYLYGKYSAGATIPDARRRAEEDRLRSVGIDGPLPAGVSALDLLYCGGRAVPLVGLTQHPTCAR